MKSKLIVVSNRLPLTIEHANGQYTCRQSSGGLISAVSTYLSSDSIQTFSKTLWIGAPDCSEKVWIDASSAIEVTQFTFEPVFVNKKRYDAYYNGFSNSLIWPLFHYFPSYAEYTNAHFDAYMEVNHQFADKILTLASRNDIIWIHDYHLMPLAGILRKAIPSLTIGFFLHIPFPSYELFRVIPKHWQLKLLEGMLGADLVGFHTIDYAEHFHECVSKILKSERRDQLISWNHRQVKADAFPISIDFETFNNAFESDGVTLMRKNFIQLKNGKKMVFSIDRLDYTKGLSNRLKGYEQFLTKYPEYQQKVVFALIVIPSRDGITRYSERKKMIDEQIGSLNSRLGSITWQPVIYQYNHLSFNELVGLYTACDLALITPLRDGMNLVSKEFVASRKDKKGVLILSEMAGSANELTEALLINPNDAVEIAEMIRRGLEMDEAEQAERISVMQEKISSYDVNAWAADFFRQLDTIKQMQLEFEVKFLDDAAKFEILETYSTAAERLFLLDYDGSLRPFAQYPSLAVPDENILTVLSKLSDNKKNNVFIISGRDSMTLEKWFGHLPIGLIAEHGAKIKYKHTDWQVNSSIDAGSWSPAVIKIMDKYVAKCPNSFIETKEFSIAWHYRNADAVQAKVRASELCQELNKKTDNLPLQILKGHKVIEVRDKNISKGLATQKLLDRQTYDFVFSIGDDVTDEDMFTRLAKLPYSFTIKIGGEASFAKYNLHNPAMALSLLKTISIYNNIEV